MSKLGAFLHKFENTAAAAAFAEAGEYGTALEIVRQGGASTGKRVLVGMDGGGNIQAITAYALDLCLRMGAGGVEVLQVLDASMQPAADAELTRRVSQGKGVRFHSVCGQEKFEATLARYAKKRRDLVCLVVDAAALAGAGAPAPSKRKINNAFHGFPFPVVIYRDGTAG